MVIGDLVSAIRRGSVLDAREGELWVPYDEAAVRAREALSACTGIDVIIDGTHKAEALSFVAELARRSSGRIRGFVTLPGEDALLLENVWASGVKTATLSALESADGILIIGDPFSGYPRSALPILRLKRSRHKAPLIVVDNTASRVGMFATHEIITDPPSIGNVLACFAPAETPGIKGQAPVNSAAQVTIKDAVTALDGCSRPMVVVASMPGRGVEWPLLGFIAGRLARARGTELVVLTQYGNAAGVTRFLTNDYLLPIGDLLEESSEERGVILLGEDILCVPPDQRFESYVRSAKVVVQVSISPSRDFPGIHFPGAVFVEEAGHVLDETGAWTHVPRAIPPPCGLRPMLGVLAAVTVNGADRPEFLDVQLPGPRELEAPDLTLNQASTEEGPIIGVMTMDPKQFVGGAFTSSSRFHVELGALPEITISRHDSEAFELRTGNTAILSTAHNACRVRVQISDRQPTGVVAVTAGNQAVRRLFPYDLVDGFPIARPAKVELAKSEGSGF